MGECLVAREDAVTSPIRMEPVECPSCHRDFETPYRASFNKTLDDRIDDAYFEAMTTGRLPRVRDPLRDRTRARR
jgi:hypothetical protein